MHVVSCTIFECDCAYARFGDPSIYTMVILWMVVAYEIILGIRSLSDVP